MYPYMYLPAAVVHQDPHHEQDHWNEPDFHLRKE